MWIKKINKIGIFVLLIGFSALCYAQTAADGKIELIPKDTDKIKPLLPSTVLVEDDIDLGKKNKTTEASEITTIAFKSEDDDNEQKHRNKTTTTTSTTSVPPETTTTTTTTTTTPIPTTKSTEKPTTPPTTSTTSTTSTTTTTTSTTTTTVKPTPGPTPKPNPPKPDIGAWNCSCIRLQMAAEVNFTYPTKDNKTSQAHMTVPSSARVSDCECTEKPQIQHLVLEWSSENYPNFLTVRFEKNNSEYGLYMLMFKIQSSELPNAKENITIQLVHEKNIFLTPEKMSYHCTREQKLNLTSTLNKNETVGSVALMDLQFEAFYSGNNTSKFSTAKDCDAIDTPDIIPIAVGIALVALIVIILISYLVARRRSTARGYMSF